MKSFHDRFYSSCYNSFKVKSKMQVILVVESWHKCSEGVVEKIKKWKKFKIGMPKRMLALLFITCFIKHT